MAQNAVMFLRGVNFDFSSSIPLTDVSPGNSVTRYYDLNFISDDTPEFIVQFTYNDSEGINYESNQNRFTVYLNYPSLSNVSPDTNIMTFFNLRTVILILVTLLLIIACIILLIRLTRKKGV